MTDRSKAVMPRTMSAEEERKWVEMYCENIGPSYPGPRIYRELVAEREAHEKTRDVSRQLADTAGFLARCLEQAVRALEVAPLIFPHNDSAQVVRLHARAALAQYTATQPDLASSKDPGADTSPSQGGRD